MHEAPKSDSGAFTEHKHTDFCISNIFTLEKV